jgi:hypothetical protein
MSLIWIKNTKKLAQSVQNHNTEGSNRTNDGLKMPAFSKCSNLYNACIVTHNSGPNPLITAFTTTTLAL